MYFPSFIIIFHWKRAWPIICTSLIEIGPVVLNKISKFRLVFSLFHNYLPILSMDFCYFLIISPWKRAWPFIKIKLTSFYPKMICAKFGWNSPSGSGKKVKDQNVKSLQMDSQVIRKSHLSFQLGKRHDLSFINK